MTRLLSCTALAAALTVAGCADPAADKVKVTASAPQPIADAPAPAPAGAPQPAAAAAASASLPAPSGTSVPIDPEGSKIGFTGSKVTGKHDGGFKTFSGFADLTPDGSGPSRIAVEIDMGSTWADNDRLTGHLKSPDFFDVAKFPKATFVSTEIKPGGEKGATHTVTGNLTLHGVTKSISFPAAVAVKDGGLTLNSEFALNRKDFAVNYPGMSNDLIRDDVVIRLDVKAPKKG